jgi:diadenosine tetraphosphatase ApaH/serine/threonine PP2A family protein phosphatase
MSFNPPSDPQKDASGKGRLLAVGDIHGCLDHLERLMARVRPGPEDRVIFLGDYTDRGPDGKGLRLFYETENFIFVHAGLRPGKALDEQDDHDLVWIREKFIFSDYDWGKTVVFGHTPRPEPLFTDNKIGLDTGAVYGRVLTCCDVERRQCWNSAPLPPA